MSHTWTKRLLILGAYIQIYPPPRRYARELRSCSTLQHLICSACSHHGINQQQKLDHITNHVTEEWRSVLRVTSQSSNESRKCDVNHVTPQQLANIFPPSNVTFVWTVNFTLSRSLRASDISTSSVESPLRSTDSVFSWNKVKDKGRIKYNW